MAIRVALIGYGYSGQTFHAPLIAATPGLELTVVGSSDEQKVHAGWPEVRVVGDPRAAATDALVDLVVIATPNDTHVPLATAALEARKHVVVDKPFALMLAEAQGVAALAETQGRVLSVFHNRRWDSDFLGARAALDDRLLGDVVHFESHFDRFRPIVRDRWRERAVPGSGILYDLGPHLIDQTVQLFGTPAAVSAFSARQRAESPVEDWVHVVLDYGRLRVILHASMLVAGSARRLVLHGTKASWIKANEDVQEKQLVAGMRPGAPGWGVDPESAALYDGSTVAEVAVPHGDYRSYYAELRDAILGLGSNPVTPAQAVAVMQILEQARDSMLRP